jgi:hypothetical protein
MTQLLTRKICLSGFDCFLGLFLHKASKSLLIFRSANFGFDREGPHDSISAQRELFKNEIKRGRYVVLL